jgi:dienelactone hydrolase
MMPRLRQFVWLTAMLLLCCAAAPLDHHNLLQFTDAQGNPQPVRSAADWQHRRAQILAGMQQAMGQLPDRTHLPPLDMKVLATEPAAKFTRLTISFVASGEERIPAYLFLPKTHAATQPFAAILALHPTSELGKGEIVGLGKPNRGYGLELAQHGYVVLCPDYPSFGDYPCDFTDPLYASGSIKGIFNHMRCVDLLQSLPQVDPNRIGVIGHSLGGHNALFVAAFDTRIKAVVCSCGFTRFADYYGGKIAGWTSPRYMPRLRDVYHLDPAQVPFDFDEVLAAIAPRPLFCNAPLHDDNFAIVGVKPALAEARKVYALLGAPNALTAVHPDCAHDFPPEVRAQAYEFLDAALRAERTK